MQGPLLVLSCEHHPRRRSLLWYAWALWSELPETFFSIKRSEVSTCLHRPPTKLKYLFTENKNSSIYLVICSLCYMLRLGLIRKQNYPVINLCGAVVTYAQDMYKLLFMIMVISISISTTSASYIFSCSENPHVSISFHLVLLFSSLTFHTAVWRSSSRAKAVSLSWDQHCL